MRVIHPEKSKGKKIVVVIGGGFAGLNAALTLARQESVYVLLIDQRNHHLFQPLLYQVATAGLNPADIAVPIRAQFSDAANVEVHLGQIVAVNLNEKYVTGTSLDGEMQVEYDYLILACGAQHSYFAHPEWEPFAPGLKTLEQATEIRRRLLLAFEMAENEMDPQKQAAFLTFVVVGAGPTGMELAGAISDISRTVLIKDFRRIDPSKARVLLLEAGPRILASFPEDLASRAKKDLQELGVEVRTGARVENITADGVTVGSEFTAAKSVFWAAGVQASKMKITPEISRDRAGRIHVNKDFSVPGYPHTFIVGDMAAYELAPEKFLPGLAPAAMQAGRFVGKTILREIHGKNREPFEYLDKGQMATIGKRRAVAQSGQLRLTGLIAWLAWLFVHVFYLIDFKNRVSVISQWVWNYVFSKRGTRLITEKEWRLKQ